MFKKTWLYIYKLKRKAFYHLQYRYQIMRFRLYPFFSFYYMRYAAFIITLTIFIVLFNSFLFTHLLDLNNNIHILIMIITSRFINLIFTFIYAEAGLFKTPFLCKKAIYLKIKQKLVQNTSLEYIAITVIHLLICINLKNIIMPYILKKKVDILSLCLFAVTMLIISIVTRRLICIF